MTRLLKINRLSVHRNKHVMYDEEFHSGVNIIHGSNGSGKSTICDFMYFVLGGELKEWRAEAALANFVVAELTVGDSVVTIRREVSETAGRPLSIYFGSYDEAMSADLRQWEVFPYRRSEHGFSFSQVLFKAIGIPEAVSDGVSNITMHQLLRVMYSDQLTPVQRIFRVESFDTWQIRQAVGDLLCGLGGYDLFALQLFLREREKEYDEISTRLKSLITVASSQGDKVLVEHVSAALANATLERDRLAAQIRELLERSDEASSSSEADELVRKQKKELASAKVNVADLTDSIETLEFEIADADHFIDHLTSAIEDFDDSASTFFALGAVRFEFCPSCFSLLTDKHVEPNCHLCGAEAKDGEDESRALAVKLDLEMQINESQQLQRTREEELGRLKARLRTATATLKNAYAASEIGRRGAASKYESLLSDLSRKAGYLDREIAQLGQREALAKEIDLLSAEKARLNERISEMKDRILATQSAQQRRRAIAYTRVSENVKRFLSLDMAEHSDFGEVKNVTFDFAEDWIAINGNKNRVGSASGMVILKNSFLLSLIISSVQDSEFNLPKFMIMDNIEDKGMVEERSWNFQRIIVSESNKSKADHQIIFSTSKIAPELAGTPLVVGRKYTKSSRTLNITTNA